MKPRPFKPMLAAAVTDPARLRFPLVASPKIDGVRCVVRGGRALTRSLKPVPNAAIREWLEIAELEGLDGELVIPGGTFQDTTSAVMSHKGGIAKLEWHVFDFVFEGAPFSARYSSAHVKVCSVEDVVLGLRVVPHMMIRGADELAVFEADALTEGYEGVMLRDPEGPYKFGRSTEREGFLLKLKRFEDAEAVIVGFEEEMRNDNEAYRDEVGRTKRSSAKAGKVGKGRLGAFVLRRPDGVEFTCGGFTDLQKADFWARRAELEGRTAKYKWQRCGSKDAPRSPVFLGIRDGRDM